MSLCYHINIPLFLLLSFLLFFCCKVFSQPRETETKKLENFEKLIGGKWYNGNTYQIYEWGLDNKSVKGKSYKVNEEGDLLISEGMWFLHPGDQQVKGYFFAVNMPVTFFDYTTRFEENKIVSDLSAYTKNGAMQNYIEVLEFVDENKYLLSLNQDSDKGLVTLMQSEFVRK